MQNLPTKPLGTNPPYLNAKKTLSIRLPPISHLYLWTAIRAIRYRRIIIHKSTPLISQTRRGSHVFHRQKLDHRPALPGDRRPGLAPPGPFHQRLSGRAAHPERHPGQSHANHRHGGVQPASAGERPQTGAPGRNQARDGRAVGLGKPVHPEIPEPDLPASQHGVRDCSESGPIQRRHARIRENDPHPNRRIRCAEVLHERDAL